ncbi:unnamed protein product [Brassica rapa]|uniref:Secreted protein n=1 Tax=Brassica campestris TaxID=3711 RepID=A0A3P6BS97_BRACM|nr:unnamed protein product [Brassica rapa]VDD04490.1 unnamed protein product [Brassica rapa]
MFFPLPPPLLILLCQYVKTLVSGLSSVPRSGTPVTFSVRRSSSSGMAMRQRRFGCVNASAGGVIRSSPTSCLESLAWWCVELSTLRRHRLVTLLRSSSFSSWRDTLPLVKEATAQTGLYSLGKLATELIQGRSHSQHNTGMCTHNFSKSCYFVKHGTLRFYSSLCLNVSGDCEREEIVKN